MSPEAAREKADRIVQLVDELCTFSNEIDVEIKKGVVDTENLPIGHLAKVMQDESTGSHLAVGLILASLVALRYHRHRVTQSDFDSAKMTMVEIATTLSVIKREPKRRRM